MLGFYEFAPAAPELLPAARAVLGVLGNVIVNLRQNQRIADVASGLEVANNFLDWLTKFTIDVFASTQGAEAYVQGVAHDAGDNIAKVADDLKAITHHTYETVIPHSLSWLLGYIENHDLVPLRARVRVVEKEASRLIEWQGLIDKWRRTKVDPDLNAWEQFKKWFYTWPIDVLNTVDDWLQHPAHFGEWAAPPVTGPIVAYLADKAHEDSRDNLAEILVNAWSERPTRIMDAIEQWLVTD